MSSGDCQHSQGCTTVTWLQLPSNQQIFVAPWTTEAEHVPRWLHAAEGTLVNEPLRCGGSSSPMGTTFPSLSLKS